jgi:hypothetical protein
VRVVVLYRTHSEQERPVVEFEREYNRRTNRTLSLLDVNTRDGASMASLYDIMQFPCVLALGNDGQVMQMWQGEHMPLINEVTYYDQQPAFAMNSTSW